MSIRLERRVIRKTANYTINTNQDRPGTTFTNGGAAGAITFTLPTPSKGVLGWWYRFIGAADQLVTVVPPVADTLVIFNDLAADSIAFGGAGQRIGAVIGVICIETASGTYQWAVEDAGTNGVTFATAT